MLHVEASVCGLHANFALHLSASAGAAVSILETYCQLDGAVSKSYTGGDREVRGLARMVQVSAEVTLVDLTLVGGTVEMIMCREQVGVCKLQFEI